MATGGHSFAAMPRASRSTHLIKATAHAASIPAHALIGTGRQIKRGLLEFKGSKKRGIKRQRARGALRVLASPVHGSILYGGAAASRSLAHYARSFNHQGVHLSSDKEGLELSTGITKFGYKPGRKFFNSANLHRAKSFGRKAAIPAAALGAAALAARPIDPDEPPIKKARKTAVKTGIFAGLTAGGAAVARNAQLKVSGMMNARGRVPVSKIKRARAFFKVGKLAQLGTNFTAPAAIFTGGATAIHLADAARARRKKNKGAK